MTPVRPSADISPVDEVLVDWAPGETRVALLRDGRPWDLLVSRTSRSSIVGNIYLGRVIGTDRGMGAAFVDVGESRPGMLKLLRKPDEGSGPLHEGAAVMVQATRDAFDAKGPALTTRVVLPGRNTVYTPHRPGLAASRRIGGPALRQRLQGLVKRVIDPGEGIVIRTAAARSEDSTLVSEIQRLRNEWGSVRQMAAEASPPALLHRELPPLLAFLRDALPAEPVPVRLDDRQTLAALRRYLEGAAPEYLDLLSLRDAPVFEERGVEAEIEATLQRDWPLTGGGSIAIERTRALTTVDVDTGSAGGRRHGGSDLAAVNAAAAIEAARLIRFRNVSGLIVIDFAGAGSEPMARNLSGNLRSGFADDRAALTFGTLSALGLFEMSRERLGPSLAELLAGPGEPLIEPSPETRLLSALRRLVRSRPAPPACLLEVGEAEAALLQGVLAPAVREAERRLGYPVSIAAAGRVDLRARLDRT